MDQNSRFFYDKNINSFSPEGRLYQVEYAMKAADVNGATCLAARGLNTICVIEEKENKFLNSTTPSDSVSLKLNESIGCVCSGISGDLKFQISEIIKEYCDFYDKHGFEISLEQLANFISIKNQVLTQQSFTRLSGIKTIFFGIDNEIGPLLLKMDSSGIFSSHQVCCIGEKSVDFKVHIQKNNFFAEFKYYGYEKTVALTISLIQHVLKNDLKATDLKITVISKGKKFQILTLNEIDNYLEKLKKINQNIKVINYINFNNNSK